MGDSPVILYKSTINVQIVHSDLSDVARLSAQDYGVCLFNAFQLSVQLSPPCSSNSKADLEGLIKEFSSLITAHLNSSWSYFSSSPSFASHFEKSSLKAPWLLVGHRGLLEVHTRVLRKNRGYIASGGWDQLPDDTRSKLPRNSYTG